jgi:DNA polymerase/3'-5' exonuclease PolX
MSTTERRPYDQMFRVASGLVERLRPACCRIQVAGSLRRQREMVGDIEIVAIPKPIPDLFGNPTPTTRVDTALAGWPITFVRNGPKLKQFTFTGGSSRQLYTVDLFLPTAETWALIYMIRTGSSEFSRKMVTAKSQGGYKPDRYQVSDGRVWENGVALEIAEEERLFELWEMDFVAPEERR